MNESASTLKPLDYFVHEEDGRWFVCYMVPGTRKPSPVIDCPTQRYAEEEARRMNAKYRLLLPLSGDRKVKPRRLTMAAMTDDFGGIPADMKALQEAYLAKINAAALVQRRKDHALGLKVIMPKLCSGCGRTFPNCQCDD